MQHANSAVTFIVVPSLPPSLPLSSYFLGSSKQNTLLTAEEGNYPDHPQSPSHVPGKLSAEGDVSSNAVPDYESKQEAALLSGGHQYSVVHTSPSYSFGFVPPMLGSQIAPFENSESQARDVSRLPSFVVSLQNFVHYDMYTEL
jgi:hypothetical protein